MTPILGLVAAALVFILMYSFATRRAKYYRLLHCSNVVTKKEIGRLADDDVSATILQFAAHPKSGAARQRRRSPQDVALLLDLKEEGEQLETVIRRWKFIGTGAGVWGMIAASAAIVLVYLHHFGG